MLALFLVAASVGLSNFGAAIALGVSGVDARTRLRVGLVFGAFVAGMPVVGLLVGVQVASTLGHAARWISGGLLIAVGLYALVKAARAGVAERRSGVPGQPDIGPSAPGQPAVEPGSPRQPAIGPGAAGLGRLLVAGLALSLDNLVVGFALGTYRTSIAVAALVIGAVSVALSLIGLELGARIGRRAGDHGGQLAGLVLISVGIAIASGALS